MGGGRSRLERAGCWQMDRKKPCWIHLVRHFSSQRRKTLHYPRLVGLCVEERRVEKGELLIAELNNGTRAGVVDRSACHQQTVIPGFNSSRFTETVPKSWSRWGEQKLASGVWREERRFHTLLLSKEAKHVSHVLMRIHPHELELTRYQRWVSNRWRRQ